MASKQSMGWSLAIGLVWGVVGATAWAQDPGATKPAEATIQETASVSCPKELLGFVGGYYLYSMQVCPTGTTNTVGAFNQMVDVGCDPAMPTRCKTTVPPVDILVPTGVINTTVGAAAAPAALAGTPGYVLPRPDIQMMIPANNTGKVGIGIGLPDLVRITDGAGTLRHFRLISFGYDFTGGRAFTNFALEVSSSPDTTVTGTYVGIEGNKMVFKVRDASNNEQTFKGFYK